MHFDLITDIAKRLDLEMTTTIVEQISGHDLDLAAKLYIYIKTDMEEYWMRWHEKYSSILERSSLRRTLGMTFNSYIIKTKSINSIFQKVLQV